MKTKKFNLVATLTMVAAMLTMVSQNAYALVGAHSYANPSNGDVFLGGDYIEVGISKYGSFGTTSGVALPAGFYGTAARTNVGMSSNPSGFGETPDLRMDYFLPGTPEERWAVGYKIGAATTYGSNAFLRSVMNIADYTVTDESEGDLLQSTGAGTFNSTLQVSQVVSFDKSDKFFRNEVTIKNIGEVALDSARFMRSFDPDNTRDQGGSHPTQNQILYTHAAGDGKAVVMSDTTNNATDPVFLNNGSRSPILFYSSDTSAKVSTYGFANDNPYAASAYDSALAKGTSNAADAAITITFESGALAAGAEKTFVYYTSLDNRDFSEVLEEIEEEEEAQQDDGDGVTIEVEQQAPNEGDGNNDGTADSTQSNVASLVNQVTSAYTILETQGCEEIENLVINPVSQNEVADDTFNYPVGMANFSINCSEPGLSATITLYYYGIDSEGLVMRKYNSVTKTYTTIDTAAISETTISGQPVVKVVYQITDGSALDQDGLANGIIVDPAGLGSPLDPIDPLSSPDPLVGVGAPNTGFNKHNFWPAISILVLGSGLMLLSRRRCSSDEL